MVDNDSINKRIIAAIQAKGGGNKPCVVCGRLNWQVISRYSVLPANLDPRVIGIQGENFPLVPLICMNCGNTHFLNLFVLGFKSLDELVYGPGK